MSLRGKLGLVLVVASCVYPSRTALGQSQTTGRISGTIRDAQGQGIPNAVVVAAMAATGEKQRTLSNDSGDYVLLALPQGNYDLTISAGGFAASVFRNIPVGAGDAVTANAVLQIARNTTESRLARRRH